MTDTDSLTALKTVNATLVDIQASLSKEHGKSGVTAVFNSISSSVARETPLAQCSWNDSVSGRALPETSENSIDTTRSNTTAIV